jgi:hypothetical protein
MRERKFKKRKKKNKYMNVYFMNRKTKNNNIQHKIITITLLNYTQVKNI